MAVERHYSLTFPVHFWGLMIRSIQIYRYSFINYVVLSVLTYMPFLIFDKFSRFDLLDIVEFFHGNLLDIIIFLTLPTLLIERKVFPISTIQLFIQRFFASAVIISFVQLGILLFFTTFFAQISLGTIIIGIIPYIFLLFAGFFLIMENSMNLISVRKNLFNSISMVKNQFFSIFWNYINITIIMIIPLFVFSIWYLGRHSDLIQFVEALGDNQNPDTMVGQNLLSIIQGIVQEPGFKWSRITIHVLLRPIKSLFLSLLFLGLLQLVKPNDIKSFLGVQEEDASMSELDG